MASVQLYQRKESPAEAFLCEFCKMLRNITSASEKYERLLLKDNNKKSSQSLIKSVKNVCEVIVCQSETAIQRSS